MNTIKAGVKALHLDTGETELFSTVREAAEYMARYRISEQKIRQVLSHGRTGLDHVRGWTFAYVNEPFKVTDSSGRVRIRERRVFARVRQFRWADQLDYTYDPMPGEGYYGTTLKSILEHVRYYHPDMTLEKLATYADSGKEIPLHIGKTVGERSEYLQLTWAD